MDSTWQHDLYDIEYMFFNVKHSKDMHLEFKIIDYSCYDLDHDYDT